MNKEVVLHTVARRTLCPFLTDGPLCTALADRVCRCNPEPGRSWPKRCPLKDHNVLVTQGS